MRTAVLMRKAIPALCMVLLMTFASYRMMPGGPAPSYKMISGKSYVQSKNYYLLTLFNELPEVKRMLQGDVALKGTGASYYDSLEGALRNCGRNGACYLDRMKISEKNIARVSARLRELYKDGNALDRLVKQHLVPSGTYILFQYLAPAEMLVKAWEQDARGINFTLGVYAGGEKPNYPLIDSISFHTWDAKTGARYSAGYASFLYNASSLAVATREKDAFFFDGALFLALRFLEMNEREQAADFEPMAEGENAGAVCKISSVQWDKYKYSVILIPGAGPDDPTVPLSAEGMMRCRLAARLYAKGWAPYIIPSGGKVHPYKTKYCEATEMKQYMVEKLGVPADAIIIEPHARHTTTNMRNAARLMYRYGFPFDKPGVTCTTRGQSNMIGTTLPDRCMRELKEIPYRLGNRLSETEIEFYPLTAALHINPEEPMDP